MDKTRYLELCYTMEEEPDENRMPPDLNDFPLDVQNAILCYGKLGDKVAADIGYLGKDLTTLPIHMEIMKVESKELFLETILILDQRMIEKSAAAIKQERDKLKNK